MQLKNPLVFGLVAVLLVGGTILPAMSQTEPEDISQIQVTVDNSTYDLNDPISISGQISNFERDSRDPTLDLVEITFSDSSGKAVTSSGYSIRSAGIDAPDQPLTFKVMPDQIGNFKLNTVLNSVLFEYGSYVVKATIYQNGNISEVTEFEIAEVIEEKLVDEDQLEFTICKSMESIPSKTRDFSSIECQETNDFIIGDTLIIKGNVYTPDPTSDSKTSSENSVQDNQISQTFVELSIPYPKTLFFKANLHGGWITSSDVPYLEEQMVRLNGMKAKVLPDEDGNFSTAFDIRIAVFESGLYAVSANYNKVNDEKTIRIIDPYQEVGEPEITLNFDKDEYTLGEVVHISGVLKNVIFASHVTLFVESPDVSKFNCMDPEIDCTVDTSERKILPQGGYQASGDTSPFEYAFSSDYKIGSGEASLGQYTINVGTDCCQTEKSFFVTEESSIIQTTPVTDEPQSVKKIIKKFNRISDSDISIGLNDMEQDSELVPRVIQGSLFTAARGQESIVNIQVSTSDGLCIIGQGDACMVNEMTRKPGAIYEIVTIGDTNYKIRYSGTDAKLEKFSILPESTGVEIDIKDWNVQVIKDEQPTRFYYKVSYVNLE